MTPQTHLARLAHTARTARNIAGTAVGFALALTVVACGESSASSSADPVAVDSPVDSSSGAIAASGDSIYWIAGTTGRPDSLVRRYSVGTKSWEKLADSTQARLNLGGVGIGNNIVAVGGMRNVGKFSDLVERYDISSHKWTQIAKLPTAVSSPAVTAASGLVYVFGGKEVKDARLQSYDVASVDMAVAISADGKTVSVLPPMLTARHAAAAVAVGQTIYVIGGRVSISGEDSLPSSTNVVEIYDVASRSWREGPPMPKDAEGFAAALGSEIVFFGGGPLSPSTPMILDTTSGEWRVGAERDRDMIGSVISGVVAIDRKLYLLTRVLGEISEPSSPHVFEYAPKGDRWTKLY